MRKRIAPFSYSDAGAQAAIDAAQAAGGGVVYFPPGRYQLVPGPILHVTSSNVVIRGAGSQPVVAGGTELYIDAMRVGDTDVLVSFEGVSKSIKTPSSSPGLFFVLIAVVFFHPSLTWALPSLSLNNMLCFLLVWEGVLFCVLETCKKNSIIQPPKNV